MSNLERVEALPPVPGAIPHQAQKLFLVENAGRLMLDVIVDQKLRIHLAVCGASLPSRTSNARSGVPPFGLPFLSRWFGAPPLLGESPSTP